MEEARIEKLSKLVGGRFKLAALIQKRMKEIVYSSSGFGEPVVEGIFRRVLNEIEEGQIELKLVSPESEESPESLAEGGEEDTEEE